MTFQMKDRAMVIPADDFTGQITVTTAGTEVTGPSAKNAFGFLLKAHPDNTDTVWFFNSGLTKADGFPLDAGEATYVPVETLDQLQFDADVSGEKICYAMA